MKKDQILRLQMMNMCEVTLLLEQTLVRNVKHFIVLIIRGKEDDIRTDLLDEKSKHTLVFIIFIPFFRF